MGHLGRRLRQDLVATPHRPRRPEIEAITSSHDGSFTACIWAARPTPGVEITQRFGMS